MFCNLLPGGNFTIEIYQNLCRIGKNSKNYLINDEKPVIIDVPFRITNMNGINRLKIIVGTDERINTVPNLNFIP